MPESIINNQGRQTEMVKQKIVRHILDNGMRTGDKLLPQNELRKLFQVGAATVSRALQALENDGVLEIKERIGVFVVDPQVDGHMGRNVGIVSLTDRNNPFFALLINHLQERLYLSGCRCTMFYGPRRPEYRQDVRQCTGLVRNIEQQMLDAVVLMSDVDQDSWEFMMKHGVQPCFLGAMTDAPLGVFFDTVAFVHDALAILRGRGCRRVAMITAPGDIRDHVYPVFSAYCREREVALAPERYYLEGNSLALGRELARRVLAMVPVERPDGVICNDDIAGSGFYSELLLRQRDSNGYLPPAVSVTHNAEYYALPITDAVFFGFDFVTIAAMTVDLLLAKLQGKIVEERKRLFYSLYRVKPDSTF